MSLQGARVSARPPGFATRQFLESSNLVLLGQGPDSALPKAVFSPAGSLAADGSVSSSPSATLPTQSPRAQPGPAVMVPFNPYDSWTCWKGPDKGQTSLPGTPPAGEKRNAPHQLTNTRATMAALYAEFNKLWRPIVDLDHTTKTTTIQRCELITQHGMQTMMVCGRLCRQPGNIMTEPVIMVIASPTLTPWEVTGSPWAPNALLPDHLTTLGNSQRWNVWMGAFDKSWRNRGTALKQTTMEHYIAASVFGCSVDGAFVTAVVAPAQHHKNLDECLSNDDVLRMKLYSDRATALNRLAITNRVSDATTPAGRAVTVPVIIPLPAGAELQTGIIGSATLGSANILRICEEQWGADKCELLTSNLVKEWLDAVANHPENFLTTWHFAAEYPHLIGKDATYASQQHADAMQLALLRLSARLHLDALPYCQPRYVEATKKFQATVQQAADLLTYPATVSAPPPAGDRVELVTVLRTSSKSFNSYFAGFTSRSAQVPRILHKLNTVKVDADVTDLQALMTKLLPPPVTTQAERTQVHELAQSDNDNSSAEEDDGSGGEQQPSEPAATERAQSNADPPATPTGNPPPWSPAVQRPNLPAEHGDSASATARDYQLRRPHSPDPIDNEHDGNSKRQRLDHRARSAHGEVIELSEAEYAALQLSRRASARSPKRGTQKHPHRPIEVASPLWNRQAGRNASQVAWTVDSPPPRRSHYNLEQEYYERSSPPPRPPTALPPPAPVVQPPATGSAETETLANILRVRADPALQYFYDNHAREPIPPVHCYQPVRLDPAFTAFVTGQKDEVALTWLNKAINTMWQRRSRMDDTAFHILDYESFPLELCQALRRGDLSFDPTPAKIGSINHFTPMGLLALLPNSRPPGARGVVIPDDGLTYETARTLASTYCAILALARPNHDVPRECPIELVRALQYYTRTVQQKVTGPGRTPLATVWDASRDNRVAYTFEYLSAMSAMFDAFYSLASQGSKTRSVTAVSPHSQGVTSCTLLEFKYDRGFAPFETNDEERPTLASTIQIILTDSLSNFRNQPTVANIPASLLAPVTRRPPTTQQHPAAAGGTKGKNSAAPDTQPPRTATQSSAQSKLVELFHSTSGQRQEIKALRPLPGFPPTVTTKGATSEICLKSLSKDWGGGRGCGNPRCAYYHFPDKVAGPPPDVDLTKLRAFVQLPAFQAKMKLTPLGNAVLGQL